jgi:hypothetical protein
MSAPSRKFGYIQDPVDKRDRAFTALFRTSLVRGASAASVSFRDQVDSVLSQGELASCTAQSVMGALRLKHALDGVKTPVIGNRLHAYWGTRTYIGTNEWDSGGHIRDTFRFINAFGYMPEQDTINGHDPKSFRTPPSTLEQQKMFDQRDKADGQVEYYRIYEQGDDRVNAIKRALSNRMPVVFGTQTTQEFLDYKQGYLKVPGSRQRLLGGHAMYVCGYTSEGIVIPNSWDTDYGDNGFLRLSWDYVKWEETQDIWAVSKAPYFSNYLEVAA